MLSNPPPKISFTRHSYLKSAFAVRANGFQLGEEPENLVEQDSVRNRLAYFQPLRNPPNNGNVLQNTGFQELVYCKLSYIGGESNFSGLASGYRKLI